ncbi:hypothetical protein CBR_g2746 [Chara braunii]|uniref:BED-type domain-containing protein n=1 Tax=Chara braunii TaxID=69332 RepID=A0A388KDR0_CHABU|nr:hypothetical protein CBR_g2746 [Chara braunii]|eukprot:GBG68194.1 hypothetical protein CBR_g2746 [Chara braunii]
MEGVSDFLSRHPGEFTLLENGRVKCTLSGHEILPDVGALEAHLQSKRYKLAKFESQELVKLQPHVVQHPEMKDKLLCNLTGKVVNKTEEAVWKHIMGKRFQSILKEKEEGRKRQEGTGQATAKEGLQTDAAMSGGESCEENRTAMVNGGTGGAMSVGGGVEGQGVVKKLEGQTTAMLEDGKRNRRRKVKIGARAQKVDKGEQGNAEGDGVLKPDQDGAAMDGVQREKVGGKRRAEKCCDDDMDVETMSDGKEGGDEVAADGEKDDDDDEVDFWSPPPGARWDGDDGGKRWKAPPKKAETDQQKAECMDVDMEDADGLDGKRDGQEGEEDVMIEETRIKRTTAAVGPAASAPQKKKKKKNKKQSTAQGEFLRTRTLGTTTTGTSLGRLPSQRCRGQKRITEGLQPTMASGAAGGSGGNEFRPASDATIASLRSKSAIWKHVTQGQLVGTWEKMHGDHKLRCNYCKFIYQGNQSKAPRHFTQPKKCKQAPLSVLADIWNKTRYKFDPRHEEGILRYIEEMRIADARSLSGRGTQRRQPGGGFGADRDDDMMDAVDEVEAFLDREARREVDAMRGTAEVGGEGGSSPPHLRGEEVVMTARGTGDKTLERVYFARGGHSSTARSRTTLIRADDDPPRGTSDTHHGTGRGAGTSVTRGPTQSRRVFGVDSTDDEQAVEGDEALLRPCHSLAPEVGRDAQPRRRSERLVGRDSTTPQTETGCLQDLEEIQCDTVEGEQSEQRTPIHTHTSQDMPSELQTRDFMVGGEGTSGFGIGRRQHVRVGDMADYCPRDTPREETEAKRNACIDAEEESRLSRMQWAGRVAFLADAERKRRLKTVGAGGDDDSAEGLIGPDAALHPLGGGRADDALVSSSPTATTHHATLPPSPTVTRHADVPCVSAAPPVPCGSPPSQTHLTSEAGGLGAMDSESDIVRDVVLGRMAPAGAEVEQVLPGHEEERAGQEEDTMGHEEEERAGRSVSDTQVVAGDEEERAGHEEERSGRSVSDTQPMTQVVAGHEEERSGRSVSAMPSAQRVARHPTPGSVVGRGHLPASLAPSRQDIRQSDHRPWSSVRRVDGKLRREVAGAEARRREERQKVEREAQERAMAEREGEEGGWAKGGSAGSGGRPSIVTACRILGVGLPRRMRDLRIPAAPEAGVQSGVYTSGEKALPMRVGERRHESLGEIAARIAAHEAEIAALREASALASLADTTGDVDADTEEESIEVARQRERERGERLLRHDRP